VSFTYRPTPVIVLSGKTVGDDHVPLRRLPAGTMHGYTPNMASPALNAIGRRTLRGDPWIISSGTMGRFLLGDDGSGLDFPPIDTTSVDITGDLTPPSFTVPQLAPIVPSSLPVDTTMAPITGTLVAPTISPISISSQGVTAQAPPSGVQATVAAGTSLAAAIANFFKPAPAKAVPMTAAQPGVYNAYAAQPSWFGQQSLVAGMPNYQTLLLGGAAILLLSSVFVGGKAGYRR